MNKYTMSIFVSMEMSHGTSLSQSVRTEESLQRNGFET